MTKQVLKSLLNKESVAAFTDFLKISGQPFVEKISTYTTKLEGAINVHFISKEHSNRMFAAYSKLKRECTLEKLPIVDKENLQYYKHVFTGNVSYNEIYNFDLKAAYATCLYSDGFISKDTYDYIMTIPKDDRLAAVGMLAARSENFYYTENGDLEATDSTRSPLENYFFYCVKKTHDLMNEIRYELNAEFLFFWVDGIYCRPLTPERMRLISELIKARGFNCSFEKLFKFKAELTGENIMLEYWQDKKEFCKLKKWNIPQVDPALEFKKYVLALNNLPT